MHSALLLAAAALGAGASRANHKQLTGKAPPSVPEFELLRYLGRWEQPYADLASDTFESLYCVVAEFVKWPRRAES